MFPVVSRSDTHFKFARPLLKLRTQFFGRTKLNLSRPVLVDEIFLKLLCFLGTKVLLPNLLRQNIQKRHLKIIAKFIPRFKEEVVEEGEEL